MLTQSTQRGGEAVDWTKSMCTAVTVVDQDDVMWMKHVDWMFCSHKHTRSAKYSQAAVCDLLCHAEQTSAVERICLALHSQWHAACSFCKKLRLIGAVRCSLIQNECSSCPLKQVA